MKKAKIVPVHKKESRQNKKNYHPILLLPIFGKMFKKVNFDATMVAKSPGTLQFLILD